MTLDRAEEIKVFLLMLLAAGDIVAAAVATERAKTLQLVRDCCCSNRCEQCVAAVEALLRR